MKNNKKIVGFIGKEEDCIKATNILVSFGFHRVDLKNKIREFAKFWLKLEDEEIDDIILEQIRERGYRVSKMYWINLSLSSVPENKDNIVISDLWIEDINNMIKPYCIGNNTKTLPNSIETIETIETIENKGPIEIKAILEEKFLNNLNTLNTEKK